MSEVSQENSEVGFLPHEAYFILNAVQKATVELQDANRAYGEAVASSGGDWAFDDPASRIAATEAHHRESTLKRLLKLSAILREKGEIPYPDPESNIVTYGSRVHTSEEDGYNEIFDLATHSIPSIPTEEDATVITTDASIGKELFGSKVGDTITWTAPGDRTFKATITKIDQLAVKSFFETMIE